MPAGTFYGSIHTPDSPNGTAITRRAGRLVVPDDPIIPFIEGDGTGPDIWRASVRVFDAAVEKAYGGKRRIVWFEVLAGEKAKNLTNEWLPNDTLEAVQDVPRRHQGPADHAGRRRHPQPQRHPAAGARPVRLRPPGPLLQRHAVARDAPRADERRDLPREHGGRLRGIELARGTPQGEKLIEFLRRRWASASRPTPASASSRCRRPARSGWCGWRSSTRSTTSGGS